MPRTTITAFTPLGAYPSLPIDAGAATLAPIAADVANKNQTPFGDADEILILAANTDNGGAHTVTVTSAPDTLKRTGDITAYSIVAAPGANENKAAVLGPFKRAGWQQPDKMLYFEADSASVKFVVIKL